MYDELIARLRKPTAWAMVWGGSVTADTAPTEAATALERQQKHIEELNAKLTCMCGEEIQNHDAYWSGHSPVSMFDYAVEQEVERRLKSLCPAG